MAIQKKHGKGRLDKWYKLAKEKGYRARAAFKLIQLNKKYGFLEKSKVLLDLCAAPGSWCQVAAETMPINSLIIGVDLSPIKPIPKVITFQSDITTEKCRATIKQHLKTWKVDTVLHDGAPNVGTAWTQDSFNQAELAFQAMKLAVEFLVEGGTFVTKVFRSKDYNPLLYVFNQLFTKVDATKPPSSRNVSAEIFVVCRGFKAPKRIDPRFLDARSVFAEVSNPTPNNEAKVYKPELKKRKREGYEEGDYTQFKEVPASEFIQTTDPIEILGSCNRLGFEQASNGDLALAALAKLPETTDEIRTACADLKVLGRKEFKILLKWRLRVREIFGFATKKKEAEKQELGGEVVQVESLDEELNLQEELQALKDRQGSKRKRERRKENEKKQKEIVRMQLGMLVPTDIGMEQQGPLGDGAMFALKAIDKTDALPRIARGRMVNVTDQSKKKDQDSGIGSSIDPDEDEDDDEEEDRLEQELDSMYENYRERKAEADAKYRAKRAREEHEDGDWEGLSASENGNDDDSSELDEDSSDDESERGEAPRSLLTDLEGKTDGDGGLSKRATNFFNQDLFKDIGVLDEVADLDDVEMANAPSTTAKTTKPKDVPAAKGDSKIVKPSKTPNETKTKSKPLPIGNSEIDSEDEFQVVKDDHEEDWEDEDRRRPDGRPDIDIITAEAMTLAHELATGKKSSHDLIDDGFNKRAFRDRDGLPDWFVEDESKHDKPQKPITKEAANAIKEKTRALNARPIKKVMEARARKKLKAAQRLEKLKKKSDLVANEEGLTEREKASQIQKLLARASQKKPRQPLKVVVARGTNRALQGRPRGVKGRYKMVDPRMKKELRAQRRIAKKKK